MNDDHPCSGSLLLYKLRTQLGLQQNELSPLVKITRNALCDMENGKRPIGELTARRLAEFFSLAGVGTFSWKDFYQSVTKK